MVLDVVSVTPHTAPLPSNPRPTPSQPSITPDYVSKPSNLPTSSEPSIALEITPTARNPMHIPPQLSTTIDTTPAPCNPMPM